MKIIVDAMGGDNAPKEIVKGSIMAVERQNIDVVLVGNEEEIKNCLGDFKSERITIVNATENIDCNEDPVKAVRTKKNSSICVGMNLLSKGDGDAFVSAGSTGAVVSAATLIAKRIKGIRRVALASVIPSKNGKVLLVDTGATADCSSELLTQFAKMGDVYAKNVMGINNPRIGLLNIGTEEAKGNNLTKETYQLLKAEDVNFVGNIEAREVFCNACDVLVADGFSGNILIKSIEGTGIYFAKELKGLFMNNLISKVCALILKNGIKGIKKSFDSEEVGGAPVLGCDGVVIKAHGNSKHFAIYNGILQAKKFVETKAIDTIKNNI